MPEQIVDFEVQDCVNCGFLFGAPKSFFDRRRQDGETFYCPACGNGMHWSVGESEEQLEIEKMQRELDSKDRLLAAKQDALAEAQYCCTKAQQRAAGYKGQFKKISKLFKKKAAGE